MGRSIAAIASLFIALLTACGTGGPYHASGPAAREGHGVLSPPETVPSVLGGIPPKHAFEADASGAFSRTVFTANEDSNVRVTVRDISLPPKQQARPFTLPGAVLLEVRAGRGAAGVAGRSTELSEATTMAIPAGTPVTLTNESDQALAVRLYVMEAKR